MSICQIVLQDEEEMREEEELIELGPYWPYRYQNQKGISRCCCYPSSYPGYRNGLRIYKPDMAIFAMVQLLHAKGHTQY